MRRILLFVLCCSFASTVGATVLLPIEFRELVASAPVIIHGRIFDVRSDWVDGRRAIETFVTIEATEYLKGNLGDRVTFKVPGGQLGRYRTVFVGAPSFAEGEDVVVFLKSYGPSYPFIIGLSQGVFRVVSDSSSGQQLVTPPAVLGKSSLDSEPIVRGDRARRTLPMDAFRRLVRQLIDEGNR